MSGAPGVDDVHQALLERISSAEFPVGAKLPPVRRLAEVLGSNPSTVDRALQRLADAGLVRTVPRRGTYITATEARPVGVEHSLAEDLDRAVQRARAAGMSGEEIGAAFAAALTRAGRQPTVAFVECNASDLEQMAAMVENATEVELERVLLTDAADVLADGVDVIAAPLFHVADLAALGYGLDRVVELNFVPGPGALRRLATIDPGTRVAVAAPTQRGLDRLSALVRQYYPGAIELFHSGATEGRDLAGVDTLVHSAASGLPPDALDHVADEIVIAWELDPGSALSFRSRVNAVLEAR